MKRRISFLIAIIIGIIAILGNGILAEASEAAEVADVVDIYETFG